MYQQQEYADGAIQNDEDNAHFPLDNSQSPD